MKKQEVYRIYVDNNILYDICHSSFVAMNNFANAKKQYKDVKVDVSDKPLSAEEKDFMNNKLNIK